MGDKCGVPAISWLSAVFPIISVDASLANVWKACEPIISHNIIHLSNISSIYIIRYLYGRTRMFECEPILPHITGNVGRR